jgi:hypothetical protein
MTKEDIEELKDELKKLKPSQKLKRLNELKLKRKSEIDEIGALIEDSEKEMKNDQVAEEIVPARNEVDISRLFEGEGSLLENELKTNSNEQNLVFSDYSSITQMYNDYTKLQDIAYASLMGFLTENHLEAIDKIGERLDRTNYQTAGQEIADMLVASRAAIHKIRKYAGTEGRRNF